MLPASVFVSAEQRCPPKPLQAAREEKTEMPRQFVSAPQAAGRRPPLTTSFGISAFDMSRGTHPPTLPMSSRMHHFPNRRPGYGSYLDVLSSSARKSLRPRGQKRPAKGLVQ